MASQVEIYLRGLVGLLPVALSVADVVRDSRGTAEVVSAATVAVDGSAVVVNAPVGTDRRVHSRVENGQPRARIPSPVVTDGMLPPASRAA